MSSAGSAFSTEGQDQYPTFQESQTGPWGHSLGGQVARTAALNVPFDQVQFEEAKQNGCLAAPCKAYPSWPPPYGTGFIYPTLQKTDQDGAMGDERGCFPMASPFVDTEPVLPSVNITETVNGNQYSPTDILKMYDCLNTPQPLSNKCFGYMPYDATYMAATRSQGGQAKGWLDDPFSPVPITSDRQPVAVGIDIPSQVPSDRNVNFNTVSPPSMSPQQPAIRESFVAGVRPINTHESIETKSQPQLPQPQPQQLI